MKKKNILGIFVVILLISLLPMSLFASKGSSSEEKAAGGEKVFKVGILGPFSGPSARTGKEFKGSATMAFEAINWKIGDYKIVPVWIDSQSDPAKATQAYEQVIVQYKI